MSGVTRVQDGVHGLMEFVGMQTAVVEALRTREIQRLRRIRQLGLAHLVFPGAEHSRLVHSIGAAHLAIRFATRIARSSLGFLPELLVPREPAIRDVALAALCHDIGHGPLSHMWEKEVIGDHFDKRAWCGALGLAYDDRFKSLAWHELVGQALLNWPKGQLHQILEQQEEGTSERIRHLLLGDYYLSYMPMILSGDVDADRSDYILRDAHETGVQYGRYDLNWLVSTITVGRTEAGRLVVGFDRRKAPRVIEQFLIARRALYDTVYYHKAVKSAEVMVGLLLRRLRHAVQEAGVPDFMKQAGLFAGFERVISGSTANPDELLSLDDYSLWVLIRELGDKSKDATLADLARRLVERDLFKMVPCDSAVLDRFLEGADAHNQIRSAVGKFCAGDPSYYYYITSHEVSMVSADEMKRAYFVDLSNDRAATPVRDHDSLSIDWRPPAKVRRLFVPREARDEVKKLVQHEAA